jgi:hypothetical protein
MVLNGRPAPRDRARKIALCVLTIASLLAAAVPAARAAGPATAPQPAAPRTAEESPIPWNTVGPGWVLTQYAPAIQSRSTLYLFSPQGIRYQLASPQAQLVAWSPDGTRALFIDNTSAVSRVEQLTLATGELTIFKLAGGAMPIGYAMPGGSELVGTTSREFDLFSQNGALTGRLRGIPAGPYEAMLYSANGTEFAVGGGHGLTLVSSRGRVLRQLPVPGMATNACGPVRWWDGTTILADCSPPLAPGECCGTNGSQLWLVPVNGTRPAPLIPSGEVVVASGYTDAWQLRSGLYVDDWWEHGEGLCRQAGDGCAPVSFPGTGAAQGAVGAPNQAVTALGSWLLVVSVDSYANSQGSLMWFDPATGAERWLIRAPAGDLGSTTALPFNTPASAAIG